MAATSSSRASNEMFVVLKSPRHALGARIGRMTLAGAKVIETPHFLGNTSRGAVPHITPDNFRQHTSINGVYVGLEDFIERSSPKRIPPLYKFRPPDDASVLRRFIGLPDETVLVLGPRRTPPIAAPASTPNTHETVSVYTSVGFRALSAEEYAEAAEQLRPDIAVGLGDIPYARSLGSKRVEKAADRCIQWLQDHVALRRKKTDSDSGAGAGAGCLFASLLPVSCAKQQFYMDVLQDDLSADVAGLSFYGLETLEDLPESLWKLPRLAFTVPDSPHEVLRQVALGLDVFTIPFVGAATDAGIALDFAFPGSDAVEVSSPAHATPKALGIDMWSPSHATDLSPLTEGCQCYACVNHHCAYIQHLLAAKEMLGWVLLQIHNHHTMDSFFAGIRESIASDTFDEDIQKFARSYESRLPAKTGLGPRVRGYEFKAEGPGEPKKNTAAFTMLDEGTEKLAEAAPPGEDVGADALQQQGFAQKQ